MPRSKRDNLLNTAEMLFYREGFHATGIDRVIREAGVARMTLYHHFPSKEALVMAVLRRRHRRYFERLDRAITDAVRAGQDPLRAVTDAHFEWLEGPGPQGCMLIKAIAEYAAHEPQIDQLAAEYKQNLLALLRELWAVSGRVGDDDIPGELFVVLEGATSLIPVIGGEAVTHGRHMAAHVLGRSSY